MLKMSGLTDTILSVRNYVCFSVSCKRYCSFAQRFMSSHYTPLSPISTEHACMDVWGQQQEHGHFPEGYGFSLVFGSSGGAWLLCKHPFLSDVGVLTDLILYLSYADIHGRCEFMGIMALSHPGDIAWQCFPQSVALTIFLTCLLQCSLYCAGMVCEKKMSHLCLSTRQLLILCTL